MRGLERGSRREIGRRGRRGVRLGVSALVAGLGLWACDSTSPVESLPGGVPEGFQDPAVAEAAVTAAASQFECAWSNVVYHTAHLSGELLGAGRDADEFPLQTRAVFAHHQAYATEGCDGRSGLYAPLSAARAQAEEALAELDASLPSTIPDRDRLLGRAALYSGFIHAAFGEAFCEARFEGGTTLSPRELFAVAEDRFTIAYTMARRAGDDETQFAALLGRARVRLPQGKLQEATNDARRVPRDFILYVHRSEAPDGGRNDVYVANNLAAVATVDPYYWGVEWDGVPDPRVPVQDAGEPADDGVTPLHVQGKYTWEGAGIPLATWEEAQLIVAEVDGGAVAREILDELHFRAGLPLFEGTEEEEVQAQVREERRRELFLEGHRLADLRRFGIAEEWNRVGTLHPWTGRPFGGAECFPQPVGPT